MGRPFGSPDAGIAVLGTVASAGALFSAAACCVLPVALGAAGIGIGGLAAFVPFHLPLTIAAALAVVAGWSVYLQKRRARSRAADCVDAPPRRGVLATLCLASLIVVLSALWPGSIEQPLVRLLGGS